MKVILTNIPSFYKINLFNRIAKKEAIQVFFTGLVTDGSIRDKDFFKGNMCFHYKWLKGNQLSMAFQFMRWILGHKYDELILMGWETLVPWPAIFFAPRRKSAAQVESSIYESYTTGWRAAIKKIFFSRLSKCYCSGKAQAELVRALKFRGKIVITKGVGIFNYIPQPSYEERKEVRNFIFVGRLSEEKNIGFLINQINKRPELHLDIIGSGPKEEELKKMAKSNTRFYGAVKNTQLSTYYQHAEVFVLPSKSETWGLVVEEALNNGLPVMVSDHVGCAPEIVNEHNGVVFKLIDEDFENKLQTITNVDKYNEMRKFISHMDFEKIEERQVNCYID